MDHVGIDVHKRESQLCMLNPEGEVTEVRISTTRERFRAVLGDQPRAKVLIESSTESEWVARCLEGLRAASGSAEHFPERVSRLEMPGRLRSEVAPLLAAMVKVNEQLAWCDAAVEEATKNDPMVALLWTAPRIGPVTAAAFRAVVDNVERSTPPPPGPPGATWTCPSSSRKRASSRRLRE